MITDRIVKELSARVLELETNARVRFGGDSLTFDEVGRVSLNTAMSFGPNGGIYQGTGTFEEPGTGTKIFGGYDSDNNFIGLIGGWSAGVLQWYADTDGKLYAGGGHVSLSSTGITLDVGTGITTALKFNHPGTSSSVRFYSTSDTPDTYFSFHIMLNSVTDEDMFIEVGSGFNNANAVWLKLRPSEGVTIDYAGTGLPHLTVIGGINVGGATGAAFGELRGSIGFSARVDGSGGGFYGGASSDVQWYRSAAGMWYTPDQVTVASTVTGYALAGTNAVTTAVDVGAVSGIARTYASSGSVVGATFSAIMDSFSAAITSTYLTCAQFQVGFSFWAGHNITVTTAQGLYVNSPSVGGTTPTITVSNIYGVRIDAQALAGLTITNVNYIYIAGDTAAIGTNKYGIYMGAISGASTLNYAIYTNAGAVRFGGAFGCNAATPQTAYASGGAAPAGGTGATAGAYDTAAHRDALITLVNNIRTALVNNGIMS